jgi:2OG-Fe(II) oxygenase superfamily
MTNPTSTSLDYKQVIRSYATMKDIMDGSNKDFLNEAVLMPDHPLSQAFSKLEQNTIGFVSGHHYIDSSMYSKILVDGVNIVGVKEVPNKHNPSRSDKVPFIDLEALRKLGTVAPFGKGDKTVVDEVRKALEVKADRIVLKTNPNAMSYITTKLQEIAPSGTTLVPKLYKLHMYEQGGHFEKHRDTLHADNHYATLIVVIPSSKFTGGELLLEDNHGIMKDLYLDADDTCLDFGIFLTDTPHQVMPVLTGTRVVLQYDVYLEHNSPSKPKVDTAGDNDAKGDSCESHQESDDESDDGRNFNFRSYFAKVPRTTLATFTSVIKECNDGLSSLVPLINEFIDTYTKDSTISFLFVHQYALNLSPENLKGSDRVLYETISNAFHVELGFAVNSVKTDYDGNYGRESEYKSIKIMDYNHKVKFGSYIADGNFVKHDGVSYLFCGKGASFERVQHSNYSEHTGNESARGEYVYVSMVLSVGPRK